jgi:hypothetical protein
VHCELIVPGLFSSAALETAATRYPALEVLLARGRRESPESRTLEQWLLHAFEQPGEALAAGALGVAARGDDPGEGWWARADPVHLRLLRDRAIVVPAEAMEISQQEADALAGALNRHFADTAQFDTLDSRRWTARLKDEKQFLKHPALEAAGRDVPASGGSEAMLTEIQMLLHAHPVNEAREARGEPAINSLWLWGGGQAPREAHAPWRSLAAGDPSALGLAQLAGMRRLDLPASAPAWLDGLPGEGRHLAVLDTLRAPSVLEQQADCAAGLDALERHWFTPLLAALRAERIGMVTVRVPDAAPGAAFETVRGDLRRFWRRPRSLARYA